MAKIQSIIDRGDKLIRLSQSNLISGTQAIELRVFSALMELFDNVDITNGKLSSTPKAEEFLSYLDYKVFKALTSSGYGNAVNDFVSSFDGVAQNVIDVNSALGNPLVQAKDINPIKKIEVAKVVSNLTAQGMHSNFISPITQGIYRNLMFGATVADTKEFIKSQVVSTKDQESRLLKYVGQVATDGIHQFDGSMNQTIKEKFNLTAIQYTGSIIEDSRAQCMKWISMAIIKDEDLQAEIDFAVGKSYYSNKKCSGMIEGTNTANFCSLRGGRRCRHRAFPIRLVKR